MDFQETALYHFGTDHAECNVHMIRYLRKNTEEARHEWSGQMITLLCEANKESGHEMYCSILTIIETLKRKKWK